MTKDYELIPVETFAKHLKPNYLFEWTGGVGHITRIRQLAKGYYRVWFSYNGKEDRFDILPTNKLRVLVNLEL